MHGHSGGRPREPRPDPELRPFWILVGEVLLREGTIGLLLFAVMGRDPLVNGLILLSALALTMALTLRFGVLRHRGWRDALSESLIVFCGALGARNVLLVLFKT